MILALLASAFPPPSYYGFLVLDRQASGEGRLVYYTRQKEGWSLLVVS